MKDSEQQSEQPTTSAPWWQVAFGPLYTTVYQHRSDEAAQAEVAGVQRKLAEQVDSTGGTESMRHLRILDACCGNGRHLDAMRQAGLQAWGFDFSRALLAEARHRTALQQRLLQGDMRRLPFADQTFDAVTLFFTAFGYFNAAENAATLAGFIRLLRPGGQLMLDLPNRQQVIDHLVPESERETNGWHIREQRRWDGERVRKVVEAHGPAGEQERYEESVQLYSPEQMHALAEQSGAWLDAIWPSLLGPDEDTGRMVCWLQVA